MGRLEGTDPSGSGINEQKVNKEGQALTFDVTQTELEHESEENGAAYNWSSKKIDIDAGDTVLLLKNTSDNHLHIDYVKIANGPDTSEYVLHLPTTEVTPTGGTVVTGTNLNTASSNVADASARSDETNNVQGNVLETLFLQTNVVSGLIFTPGLILGKNKSVGIDVIDITSKTAATFVGHFEV